MRGLSEISVKIGGAQFVTYPDGSPCDKEREVNASPISILVRRVSRTCCDISGFGWAQFCDISKW
jgi:hypothetical protein